jgi:hypothetical protein
MGLSSSRKRQRTFQPFDCGSITAPPCIRLGPLPTVRSINHQGCGLWASQRPNRADILVSACNLAQKEEASPQLLFELSQREVCRVGLRRRSNAPTHRVELPDQPGVATPRVRRGDFLDPIVPPHPARATERRNAALRAHSCSGKNEDSVSGGNGEHG